MSGYFDNGRCKDNCAASVKKITPQNYLVADCFNRNNAKNCCYNYGLIFSLDKIKFMRHNQLITKKENDLINERYMTTMKNSTNDKDKRLKKQGVLNPHPEKVKNELFLDSTLEFFDPHDQVQVKYEMLRSVEKDDRPVTEASKMFGFSRPAFYQIQFQFKERGITGFIPKRPGPKSAHKLTADVVSFIEYRIKEGCPLRARALVALIKKKFNKDVHPRSIERAIKRREKKRANKND